MLDLLLWISLYALLLGAMAAFSLPLIQIFAGIIVLTTFVIIESRWGVTRSDIPVLPRCSLVVAHYATAFSVAIGVCCALYNILPEPVPPPKAPLPFLAAVLYVVSGQLFADVGHAVGRGIAIVITYYQLFALFSTVAFSSSLFALRHWRSAKWYALFNAPGTCLFAFFVIAAFLGE